MMAKVAVLLIALLSLGACGSLGRSGTGIQCPILPAFTAAQQATVADELPQDGPETIAAIAQYVRLRQACEAHAELDQ